jgi:hypothetical protein
MTESRGDKHSQGRSARSGPRQLGWTARALSDVRKKVCVGMPAQKKSRAADQLRKITRKMVGARGPSGAHGHVVGWTIPLIGWSR